ncbi:aspartate aminotransferase family protein [candidate division KSB1 bacterium]
MKYDLIKLNEVEKLSLNDIKDNYYRHINTGIPKVLNMLGFDQIEPVYSEGLFIYAKDGRKIYDFTGGISVLNLGHNHPRILKVRREFNEKKRPEVWKTYLSPYLAALSRNLAAVSPGDLNYSFLCNSGAEANEGALKIAEKYQGLNKKKIVYTDISFHGKTHAAMSVSGCETSKSYFKLLNDCISIPYGNWREFEDLIKESCNKKGKKNDIIAIILEAIHAEGVIIPPKGYLKNIRRLCDEYDILMIIDDIFCGFGRTGRMFSFEYEDIIPDIFTVSKSLGGGKASIAAYIARDHIFKKAYGNMKDSMIHTTTFNGFGEECCTAIESINILVEENLVENSKEMGEYFLLKLIELKDKYPKLIKDVRGIGLLLDIEFKKPAEKIISTISKVSPFLNEFSEGFLTGMILSLMMHKYNILLLVGQHNKSNIIVNPPLIINKENIDYFIESFSELLSGDILGMIKDFSKMKLKWEI